ncbi:MAG TPA: hypothetical protein VHC91_14835 [Trinickia sp.]|nr:hypothetical protein [Trinickia sp.]HVW51650.1 hypothetical protein [Trinickia sp.]
MTAGSAAQAHWRLGVYMGGPAYPYYYPAPVVPAPYYYAPYPPPVVIAPGEPDVTYVERSQENDAQAGDQPPQGTWWYCDKTKTYYPYVKQCASGWREVPATPPAPRR